MSLSEFQGKLYAYKVFMASVQQEIDSGERKGVDRKWKTPNPAKTVIGWFERRVIRGEFKRRA